MQDLRLLDISAEHWGRVRQVLDRVGDATGDALRQALTDACGDDANLQQHAIALLEAGGRTIAPPVPPSEMGDESPAIIETVSHIGQRVGPYRLLAKLGEGGMGIVYKAERADGRFEQQVAVKLLPLLRRAPGVRRRFELEQQVLASLQHPNIATLHGGGVTDSGEAYFAMELIDGSPITDYCEDQDLGVDARLRLILQVSEALQYAHRKLVLHRDVKPSNILVMADGRVKLLDFGISKLLAGTPENPMTQTGEGPMTLDYAAPEQVKGETLTIETDVYQLGTLMYEVLTDCRPFRNKGDLRALTRAICEEDPTKPSTISKTANLSADLDAIVLRAMRKAPERRYHSMDALRADIRSYLEGMPVAARKRTFRYVTGKFVRRHKWGVAANLLIFTLLLAYALTAKFQADETRRALKVAQLEQAKAEQMADFMEGLFTASDPDKRNEEATVSNLLDAGAATIQSGLGKSPDVQAQMVLVIGRLYHKIGALKEGANLLERGLALVRERPSAYSDTAVAELYNRAGITQGDLGHHDIAEQHFSNALARARRVAANSALEGQILMGRSLNETRQGRLDDSQASLLTAIEILRQHRPEFDDDLAIALNNRGQSMRRRGEYVEAESLLREAVSMQENLRGMDYSYLAVTLNNLGRVLGELERYTEAEEYHLRALGIQTELFDENHPRLADTLIQLGRLRKATGRFDEAEQLVRRFMAIKQSLFGEKHLSTAYGHNVLGELLQETERFEEAELHYLAAIETSRAVVGERHRNVGRYLIKLGSLRHDMGQLERAADAYSQAMELLTATDRAIADALLGYGRTLSEQGLALQAKMPMRRALAIRQERWPAGHRTIARAQGALALCLYALGENEESESLRADAIAVLEKTQFPTRQDRSLLAHLVALGEGTGPVTFPRR